jgi:hypothetical protein
MEILIVIILAFILGVFTEKARVEARAELKRIRTDKTKAVIAKATALVQDTKSAPPVKKTQKAPVKKETTKKPVAKKTVAKKKTSTPKKK